MRRSDLKKVTNDKSPAQKPVRATTIGRSRGEVRDEYQRQIDEAIIQIMPASGWRIGYLMDDGEIFIEPLVCLVVYASEDTPWRKIVPATVENGTISIEFSLCDNAMGYLAPGQDHLRLSERRARPGLRGGFDDIEGLGPEDTEVNR